jgi:cardiolipin synthase (CMP-forming)
MSEPVLTIANQLTILRMALAPVLVVLLHYRIHKGALVVFVVAGLTDLLDGLIARLGHQRTTLGATLDPVADKILLGSSYVALTWSSGLHCAIPVWLTVTLLSRDAIIVVSVAVINLTLGRRVFYPSLLGKVATGSQLLTAGVVFLMNAVGECLPLVEQLCRLTCGITVASALHYVYRASVRRGRRLPAP